MKIPPLFDESSGFYPKDRKEQKANFSLFHLLAHNVLI